MVPERSAAGLPTAIVREIGRAHNIPAAVGGRVVLGALMEPVRTVERLQECFRLHRADDDPPGVAHALSHLLGRMGDGTPLVAYTYFVEPRAPGL